MMRPFRTSPPPSAQPALPPELRSTHLNDVASARSAGGVAWMFLVDVTVTAMQQEVYRVRATAGAKPRSTSE